MIKQSTDKRKIFNFYTYDLTGKDVIIPIRGWTEEDAWNYFDRFFQNSKGELPLVDQIIEVK